MHTHPEPENGHYRNRMLPLGLLAACAIASYVLFATSGSLGRGVVTAAAISVGPGLALVPLVRLEDALLKAILVVLVSIATDICVAQAVTYASGFSWRPCAIALLGICVFGALLQLLSPPFALRVARR